MALTGSEDSLTIGRAVLTQYQRVTDRRSAWCTLKTHSDEAEFSQALNSSTQKQPYCPSLWAQKWQICKWSFSNVSKLHFGGFLKCSQRHLKSSTFSGAISADPNSWEGNLHSYPPTLTRLLAALHRPFIRAWMFALFLFYETPLPDTHSDDVFIVWALQAVNRLSSHSHITYTIHTKGRFPLPKFTARVDGPSWRPEKSGAFFDTRQLGPWTRVVETNLKKD